MDGGLLIREITDHADADAPMTPTGAARGPHEPHIAITIAGPAGDHQSFTIPRDLIAGGDLDLGGVLRLAMDHDPDGGDDDPNALARRNTFINQVRGWLPQADNAGYSMMLRHGADDDAVFVDPATPVDVSAHENQNQNLYISFAQVYAGGAEE
ncbi:MAG TPA: hypothetical protein ENN42_03460 [Thioalkalivibrio sp.]|nr:hypothetical protein [Thioalkalivibrio sp.]